MSCVPMSTVIEQTKPGGLGAFNVIQLEHAEAIVHGAEAAGRPVVLQISENTVAFHGSLAPLASACLAIAEASTSPVVVHLDHAKSPELVEQALQLGIRSVMYDASDRSHEENVRRTAAVAARCHGQGTWVEAELGEVGGKDGVHAPHARTDPGEAVAYVAATGIDALAVAVGSSHAMLNRDAELDNELIAELAVKVPVPLVLHGSSGVPDQGITEAVANGMVKINIATQLNKVMTAAVRAALVRDPGLVDPRTYLGSGRNAVAGEVERILRLLAP